MAGNYPDAPSWRMAYDRDGSVVLRIDTVRDIVELVGGDVIKLNDEGTGTGLSISAGEAQSWVVLFPELRDLDAYFLGSGSSYDVIEAFTSVDSTNGVDGTWVSLGVPPLANGAADFRTEIVSTTALAVRAFKLWVDPRNTSGFTLHTLHLYGERSPGQALNALELWHPTNDEKLPPAWLDWGNTPRGSSEDRTFRVKNVSTTSTAQAVRVAFDVLTDGAPSVPGQHLLSYGGGSFLAQVNVGDLAPGAISGPVTLRRVTASNAELGLFAFRVFAEPDAWA